MRRFLRQQICTRNVEEHKEKKNAISFIMLVFRIGIMICMRVDIFILIIFGNDIMY